MPLSQLVPFLVEYGHDVQFLVSKIVSAKMQSFFELDWIAATGICLTFIYLEGKRLHMEKLWLPIYATLLVGIPLGLPLFLYLRHDYLPSDVENSP